MAKHNVPERVGEVLKAIGETRQTAGWDCHGTFVLYHSALEKVAAHLGITFEPPQIVECDIATKHCVMVVTGHLGDKSEWSIGEAAPYNLKINYPMAMAEKRGKDRVILKLAGFHEAYSEDEADWRQIEHEKNLRLNTNGAANSSAPPAGGSAKLDKAFVPAPDLQAETEANVMDADAIKGILDTFPGAKVTAINPNKEGFSNWATACKEAMKTANNAEDLGQVITELQKAFAQYNDGASVTKMMHKLYTSYYVPACEAIKIEPQMLTPRDNQIAV